MSPSLYSGLYDRLCYSRSDKERMVTIENFLWELLKKNKHGIHPVSGHFVNQVYVRPDSSFRAIMDSMGLSPRTLERKIKHDIGLSPKKFHRIVRFNRAYSTIKNNPGMRLQDVVFRYGYYDQSHFVNEFREFTGSTPFRYFRNEDNFNHFFAGTWNP
ncbi:MAG: helix-turn-helix domain-containing protein [Bacteroidales bacterium]|nr:helix-turn-helix domain-containing protein [Bacteroidales bacterium]MDT8430729.1 helix-turn-helix domain-containing protein [Bacteroidales bacterium]